MPEFVDEREADTCEIEGCDRPTAVRLDVPWEGIRDVCPGHGRTWAQKEGVVALPIEQAREEWSKGSGVEEDESDDGSPDEGEGSGGGDGGSGGL